jgi:hypothetical protein
MLQPTRPTTSIVSRFFTPQFRGIRESFRRTYSCPSYTQRPCSRWSAQFLTWSTAYRLPNAIKARTAFSAARPFRCARNPRCWPYFLFLLTLSTFHGRLGFPVMLFARMISLRCFLRRARRTPPRTGIRRAFSHLCTPRSAVSPLASFASHVIVAVLCFEPAKRTSSNENTNRLFRQYFPKRTDLSGYRQSDLDKVALRLNQRPRKNFGFRLLRIDFEQVLRRPIEPPGTAPTNRII